MYYGRHSKKPARRSRGAGKRAGALLTAVMLIAALAVGGTVAWLATRTESVRNTFSPSHVSCAVKEDFNKTTGVKKGVNVENTGDTDAYIRVKLVTYRTNEQGQHIGGTAEIPAFAPGEGWVKHTDGFYYYTKPVAPGTKPATDLIGSGVTLTGSYNDADGGRQSIDVMAEAIQSSPANAVQEAWGVTIANGSVAAVPAGN